MPTKINPQSVSRRPKSPIEESDQPKSDPNLARHSRKCAICNHPEREFIEEDFVAWRSESFICRVYTLSSPSSIYRHASATGLLARRRRNLRGVAERILENVNGVTVTASAVIRAMRIFASITEDGQWADVPRRSIVTHIHVTQHPSPNHSVTDPLPPASLSNDHPPDCHSERGYNEHPTRLARRGGNLHLDKPRPRTECDTQPCPANPRSAPSAAAPLVTTTEDPSASPNESPVAAGSSASSALRSTLRSRQPLTHNSDESLPIARCTRAKSSRPRDRSEGSPIHVAESIVATSEPSLDSDGPAPTHDSQCDGPVAAGSPRHSESPAVTPVPPSVPSRPTDEQQNRRTPFQLDYLPRWAAGLRDAEILIGVENSSRGDSTD